MPVEFPKFKNLELSDKKYIESYTQKYLPYSDYNFTSLWAWNIKDKTMFSELDGNLIVRFSDYITGDPFYSFMGARLHTKTLHQLIDFIQKEGLPTIMRLLPEDCIRRISKQNFTITEDPDNFDYVLSIPDLMTYRGRSLRGKRNFVNRFRKQYKSTTSELDLTDSSIQKGLQELFLLWAQQKNLHSEEVENEFLALWRLLQTIQSSNLVAIGVFAEGRLVGFSINEVVGKSYAILHFEKADTNSFVGVYPHVMQETARELAARGCRYLNYEQDLGLPGLRKAKESYNPCQLLKKYTLTV